MTTLADVAKRASVSVSTAARVLSGRGYSAESTQRRVLEAAKQLGYVPNQVARSLRLKKTRMIGLLIADIENTFYSIIAKNIESVAKETGYHIVLCNSNDNPEEEDEQLSLLETLHIDGLILTPTGRNRLSLERLQKKGIRIVQIDRQVEGLQADAVLVDNEAGALKAVNHLIAAGHFRIGIMSGSRQVTTGKQRLTGYERALKENSIPYLPELVKARSFRRDHAIEDARALTRLHPAPTAIFAANNILAEACLLVFADAGLGVPQDISLVAFDDTQWMGITRPPITTVHQPTSEMALAAAEMLFKSLQSEGTNPPVKKMFQPELILRSSVAPRRELRVPA